MTDTRSGPLMIHGRLFQARMWREYAQAWDGRTMPTGIGREWVEHVLRVSRAECLRRARVNVAFARRMNSRSASWFKTQAFRSREGAVPGKGASTKCWLTLPERN